MKATAPRELLQVLELFSQRFRSDDQTFAIVEADARLIVEATGKGGYEITSRDEPAWSVKLTLVPNWGLAPVLQYDTGVPNNPCGITL